MTFSRRDVCRMLSMLAASSSVGIGMPATGAGLGAEKGVLPSTICHFEDLPVRESGGNQSRPLVSGELHDGKYLEAHETMLAPGNMPHPPHHHLHEEMFLIRQGTIEATINGRATRVGPGSAIFVASNEEHGIRNAGSTPAQYFVVAFGKDS